MADGDVPQGGRAPRHEAVVQPGGCPGATPVDGYVGSAETHSGAVLFVGDLAFKVKKPVDLGFVDWRALEARIEACEREVELNRRLTPDVYLGVGQLGAPGRPPEPAIVMRRLPHDRRLSTLVRAGADVEPVLRRIGHQLAAFHLAAPTTPLAAQAAGVDATVERWRMNHRRIVSASGRWIDGDRAAACLAQAERYLAGRAPLLEHRIEAGWARDGHGDLLADDVFCLEDGPRILDCLDFDERLRSGDVLADVAFLAMDLERLGRPDLGEGILALHRELTGDTWPTSLAHHQVAYRAQVRTLVAGLRAGQGDEAAGDEARSLLEITARHLHAGRVRLVLVGGAPGTGKSTLAAAVADRLGAVVLRSDEVRKELAGLDPSTAARAPLGEGIYDRAWTDLTYDRLVARARQLLGMGESVVLDASWLRRSWRETARDAATATVSDLVELRCVAPPELAAARADARAAAGGDASDAGAEVARALAAEEEPWPEATAIDTTGPPEVAVAAAAAALDDSTNELCS